MRVFIACLGTETNTFSSLPTGEQTYRDTAVFDGDATRHSPNPFSLPLHIWRERAEAEGHEVIEGLCAFAQPGGRTIRRVYEDYRDRILEQAQAALPLDLVLVNMHGAMVAEGYDDCEGDLLARLRAVIGPDAVMGGELDLHCHITPLMLEAATALVTYKEYPHIDIGERAEDLFRLCHDAARGRTRPVMAAHDCRMISMWRTTAEPMQTFVADMKAREGSDGILAVSFGHGFPWGDVAEVGAKTLVVADGDEGKAAALAADLGARLWAMREETRPSRHRDRRGHRPGVGRRRRAGGAGGRLRQRRRRRAERFHLHPGAPDRAGGRRCGERALLGPGGGALLHGGGGGGCAPASHRRQVRPGLGQPGGPRGHASSGS